MTAGAGAPGPPEPSQEGAGVFSGAHTVYSCMKVSQEFLACVSSFTPSKWPHF